MNDVAQANNLRKRAPTIVDVATTAGVAIGTVSRHLNGQPVRASNRDQIERAIHSLGYRRNATAVAMKTDMTRIVGLMVPALSDFHSQVLEQLTRKMRLRGRAVLAFCHDQQLSLFREGLEFFASHRVDALVLDGDERALNDLVPYVDEGLAMVLYDNDIPGLAVDRVFVDNRKSSERAIRHLVDLGHERIAIIHGNLKDSAGRERLQGYKDALAASGLQVQPDLVLAGNWNETLGYNAAKKLLALGSPPTAIFGANYNMTLGVLAFLHEQKIRIPEDISLISFDDVAALRLHQPGISAVGQPLEQIADIISDIIDTRLATPAAMGRQDVRIDANISLRNSTGRPR